MRDRPVTNVYKSSGPYSSGEVSFDETAQKYGTIFIYQNTSSVVQRVMGQPEAKLIYY
jgi:hypothetical protein